MRLFFDVGGLNVNYVRLTASAGAGRPFGGTPWAVPGTIQNEDFDEGGEGAAYHDHTSGNAGGVYRATDVDIARDTLGGYTVGWAGAGEWLNYTVNVAVSGTYRLTARIASPGSGGILHVEFNGVDRTGPIQVPATGGWQVWRGVAATVSLDAGVQTMRLVLDRNSSTGAVANFTWMGLERQ
jgi:hypothetical protein